ncbi:MAG: hypothetical protein ABIR79_19035, partial [Candidatus Binatia bacterium]
ERYERRRVGVSVRGLRQALRAQPRWMLAVLLAFAIETLPPPSALVSHRHAGGSLSHSHAGPIARATIDDAATRPIGEGLAHAPVSDLHQHVVHPVIAIRGPAVSAPDPAFLVSALFVPTPPATSAAALHPGQARAPPSFDA